MPRYEVVLRDGDARTAEYDSGAASVVAGDDIELEGALWRVVSVEVREDVERLVCIRAEADRA